MKICQHCGQTNATRPKGKTCAACYQYERRTGHARPLIAIDLRAISATTGEAHPAWKGDDARPKTKRARAQRMYPLGKCERCDSPAVDRHHKDGDTGNNVRKNVERLCRACHMEADGRLAKFKATRIITPVQDPKLCGNCGRPSKPLRKGLCHACNEYQRRQGKPRPYVDDGRLEKVG